MIMTLVALQFFINRFILFIICRVTTYPKSKPETVEPQVSSVKHNKHSDQLAKKKRRAALAEIFHVLLSSVEFTKQLKGSASAAAASAKDARSSKSAQPLLGKLYLQNNTNVTDNSSNNCFVAVLMRWLQICLWRPRSSCSRRHWPRRSR